MAWVTKLSRADYLRKDGVEALEEPGNRKAPWFYWSNRRKTWVASPYEAMVYKTEEAAATTLIEDEVAISLFDAMVEYGCWLEDHT